MKNLFKKIGASLALLVAFSVPAHAALDTTALVAGLGELDTLAALIVGGLIAFAITWMVGKKAFSMIRSAG